MYNGVKGPYGYRRGRAEGYAWVPAGPPKKQLVLGDCAREGKAQMKHLVSAYLVASWRIVSHGMRTESHALYMAYAAGTGGGGSRRRGAHFCRRILAPVKFAAQRLCPSHGEIAYAHRDAALDQDLIPVPSSPAPAATEFEPPALAVATGFPPEIARDP